jgi:hypothetical protein
MLLLLLLLLLLKKKKKKIPAFTRNPHCPVCNHSFYWLIYNLQNLICNQNIVFIYFFVVKFLEAGNHCKLFLIFCAVVLCIAQRSFSHAELFFSYQRINIYPVKEITYNIKKCQNYNSFKFIENDKNEVTETHTTSAWRFRSLSSVLLCHVVV